MGKAIRFSAVTLLAAMILLGGISEIFNLNGSDANTVYQCLLIVLPALAFFYALEKSKGEEVNNGARSRYRRQRISRKPSRQLKKAG